MNAPNISETAITVQVCLNVVGMDGHTILRNSARYAWYVVFITLGSFAEFFSFLLSSFMQMYLRLFCFAMRCVLVAEFAVFFCFHAVGIVLFFLHRIVVALFTFRTRQGNFCTHLELLASFAFDLQH
jgi:hypothetical protein